MQNLEKSHILQYEMHLLHSPAIGTEVIDEADHQLQGVVAEILLDPDRGKIVALFIASPLSRDFLVLQTQDILSWGQRIHIAEAERIAPPQDILRLAPFLEEKRKMLGQRIQTKSGIVIGKCVDFQFNAERFNVEWIFPRKLLRKGIPLPATDILEVTEEAIIVKDQTPKEEKAPVEERVEAPKLEPVITPAPGRSIEEC